MSQSTGRARLPFQLIFGRLLCGKVACKTTVRKPSEEVEQFDDCHEENCSTSWNQTLFAEPLHVSASWQAPIVEKSDRDKAYLLEILNRSYMFSTKMCTDVDKKRMVDAMERFETDPKHILYSIGEEGGYFYILQFGTVSFFDNCGNIVSSSNKGSSIGEVELLYNGSRTATCRTDTDCVLWRLDHITCRNILASDQLAQDKKRLEILQKVPYFMDLDDKSMSTIRDSLRTEKQKKGTCIITKGDIPDKFYIISLGRVKVHGGTTNDKGDFREQILSAGFYFGDLTIISNQSRDSNVTLLEDSTFFTLSADVFRTVLGDLNNMILSSRDRRTLASIPLFLEAAILPHEVDMLASLVAEVELKAGCTLFTAEDHHNDGLFLVRKGEVIINMPGKYQRVKAGEYFGETTLCDPSQSDEASAPTLTINSILAATVTIDTVLGVLGKEKIQSVLGRRLDTCRDPNAIKRSKNTSEIAIKELKRLRLLGTGTFGKVYLAQTKSRKNRKVFALKVQNKRYIIKQKMIQNIMCERKLMDVVSHPFVTNLVSASQDEDHLYMVLPFYQGGELLSIMTTAKEHRTHMSETTASFYGAVTLEGLEHLHKHNIVYRDFKPENVLIDINGYPVIIDLGFSKVVMDKTFTFCGTPVYLAPEIIVNKGYNKAADQWAWAVVLYEMIIGVTPFYKENIDAMDLFKRIIRCNVTFPVGSVTNEFKSLMKNILMPHSARRLGNGSGGDQDIKCHKWFCNIDFSLLKTKSMEAPWVPPCRSIIDTSCFKPIGDDLNDGSGSSISLSHAEQQYFEAYGPYCGSQ